MAATSWSSKRLTLEEAVRLATVHRRRGQRVVFTNGCFDLFHAGHVSYLQSARAAGDVLLVGLNSDTSVRAIKDRGRPLNREEDRVTVLSALACVDGIVVFDALTPLDLINAIQPDVLVKGADWPEAAIVGAEEVKQRGGQVIRVAVKPDLSTSLLMRRILKRYGTQGVL